MSVIPKKHTEYRIGGKVVPSVTTVLGVAIAKPELNTWYGRVGTKEAERQRDAAADFGGRVHDAVEQHYTGLSGGRKPVVTLDELRSDARVARALDNYIIWADKNVSEFISFEQAVYHDELLYAGTTDIFLKLRSGKMVLCDLKTSRSMHDEYHLQVAAYCKATRCEDPKVDLKAVQGAFILHMDRESQTWRPITARPFEECFPVFKACLDIFNWKRQLGTRGLRG